MNFLSTIGPALARVLSGGFAGASTLAWAHPGDHGHQWLLAVMHLLTEPDHLAGIGLVAVIAGALWARRSRRGK
jgi:hydrogenase/urease accessory protein HupE